MQQLPLHGQAMQQQQQPTSNALPVVGGALPPANPGPSGGLPSRRGGHTQYQHHAHHAHHQQQQLSSQYPQSYQHTQQQQQQQQLAHMANGGLPPAPPTSFAGGPSAGGGVALTHQQHFSQANVGIEPQGQLHHHHHHHHHHNSGSGSRRAPQQQQQQQQQSGGALPPGYGSGSSVYQQHGPRVNNPPLSVALPGAVPGTGSPSPYPPPPHGGAAGVGYVSPLSNFQGGSSPMNGPNGGGGNVVSSPYGGGGAVPSASTSGGYYGVGNVGPGSQQQDLVRYPSQGGSPPMQVPPLAPPPPPHQPQQRPPGPPTPGAQPMRSHQSPMPEFASGMAPQQPQQPLQRSNFAPYSNGPAMAPSYASSPHLNPQLAPSPSASSSATGYRPPTPGVTGGGGLFGGIPPQSSGGWQSQPTQPSFVGGPPAPPPGMYPSPSLQQQQGGYPPASPHPHTQNFGPASLQQSQAQQQGVAGVPQYGASYGAASYPSSAANMPGTAGVDMGGYHVPESQTEYSQVYPSYSAAVPPSQHSQPQQPGGGGAYDAPPHHMLPPHHLDPASAGSMYPPPPPAHMPMAVPQHQHHQQHQHQQSAPPPHASYGAQGATMHVGYQPPTPTTYGVPGTPSATAGHGGHTNRKQRQQPQPQHQQHHHPQNPQHVPQPQHGGPSYGHHAQQQQQQQQQHAAVSSTGGPTVAALSSPFPESPMVLPAAATSDSGSKHLDLYLFLRHHKLLERQNLADMLPEESAGASNRPSSSLHRIAMDANYCLMRLRETLRARDPLWFLHSPLPQQLLQLLEDEVLGLRDVGLEPVYVFGGIGASGDVEAFLTPAVIHQERNRIWSILDRGCVPEDKSSVVGAFDSQLGEDVEMCIGRFLQKELGVTVVTAPFLQWPQMLALHHEGAVDLLFAPPEALMFAYDNTELIMDIDLTKPHAPVAAVKRRHVLERLYPNLVETLADGTKSYQRAGDRFLDFCLLTTTHPAIQSLRANIDLSIHELHAILSWTSGAPLPFDSVKDLIERSSSAHARRSAAGGDPTVHGSGNSAGMNSSSVSSVTNPSESNPAMVKSEWLKHAKGRAFMQHCVVFSTDPSRPPLLYFSQLLPPSSAGSSSANGGSGSSSSRPTPLPPNNISGVFGNMVPMSLFYFQFAGLLSVTTMTCLTQTYVCDEGPICDTEQYHDSMNVLVSLRTQVTYQIVRELSQLNTIRRELPAVVAAVSGSGGSSAAVAAQALPALGGGASSIPVPSSSTSTNTAVTGGGSQGQNPYGDRLRSISWVRWFRPILQPVVRPSEVIKLDDWKVPSAALAQFHGDLRNITLDYVLGCNSNAIPAVARGTTTTGLYHTREEVYCAALLKAFDLLGYFTHAVHTSNGFDDDLSDGVTEVQSGLSPFSSEIKDVLRCAHDQQYSFVLLSELIRTQSLSAKPLTYHDDSTGSPATALQSSASQPQQPTTTTSTNSRSQYQQHHVSATGTADPVMELVCRIACTFALPSHLPYTMTHDQYLPLYVKSIVGFLQIVRGTQIALRELVEVMAATLYLDGSSDCTASEIAALALDLPFQNIPNALPALLLRHTLAYADDWKTVPQQADRQASLSQAFPMFHNATETLRQVCEFVLHGLHLVRTFSETDHELVDPELGLLIPKSVERIESIWKLLLNDPMPVCVHVHPDDTSSHA